MANHQTIAYIQSIIEQVLSTAGIDTRVMYEDSLANGLLYNIQTRDAKLLIGHQGSVLYALEHIIHAIVARGLLKQFPELTERVMFSIDVDDYKKNRQFHLKQMVKDVVIEMKRSGKAMRLPPLPKYERKFVHMYIQEQYPHLTTASLGAEPNRYIQLSM